MNYKTKLVFLTVSLFLIVACKKEKKVVSKSEVNPYLNVVLKGVFNENDMFDLYYSEEILAQYHPEDKVTVAVKGQAETQEIRFTLPEKIYPIKLRLDVGSKKHETPITLESITLSTGTNTKEYSGKLLSDTFKPNAYLEKDSTTNYMFKRTLKNNIYDPFFISINIGDVVLDLFKENYGDKL